MLFIALCPFYERNSFSLINSRDEEKTTTWFTIFLSTPVWGTSSSTQVIQSALCLSVPFNLSYRIPALSSPILILSSKSNISGMIH